MQWVNTTIKQKAKCSHINLIKCDPSLETTGPFGKINKYGHDEINTKYLEHQMWACVIN